MRRTLLAATVALGALALQALAAPTYYSPGIRDENRQLLIAEYGLAYDPYALMRVVRGSPGAFADELLPLAQALEYHLDALDRNGIRLATLATAPASDQPPQWPLVGAVWFHELGWKESGARCPVLHSVTAPVDPTIDSLVRQLPEPGLVDGDPRIGHFTTSVSEFPTNAQGITLTSILQFYENPANRALGMTPTATWKYTGWTLAAGSATQPDYIEYVCSEPSAARGQVRHNSFVLPTVDRVDD